MEANTILSADELRELWAQLAQDETLDDKYELTEHGEVVMSPKPTNRHQLLCSMVAEQLRDQLGPRAVYEAAMLTTIAGVRVPDVVWMPPAKWQAVIEGRDLLEAPDLVVEVLSPGNRKTEIAHKLRAYLASGVREAIVVALDGSVRFHRSDGIHAESALGVWLALPPELFA